jgi:uncharacterized protein (TIGR00369 family)
VPEPTRELPPYPPARHAMRLLDVESERDADGDLRGWLAVRPEIVRPSGGPRLGPVAVFVDALGGLRSISAAAPDWAFTADLSIHLLPTGPFDELVADVLVLRRGRRTLIIEIDLATDDGRPAGAATLSFAVVGRPEHLVDIRFDETPARHPLSPLDPGDVRPDDYLAELGIASPAPGIATVELTPQVSNTVGALHGGVHTSLVDEASASLGRQLLGPGAETVDVHLAFLELGRSGPLRAEAVAVGPPSPEGDRITTEVRLVDADGRLCSYATAEVVAP